METTVDLAAVGRVARRTDLREIRITEMSAKCNPKVTGPLCPSVRFDCAIAGRDQNMLEVMCDCTFVAHCGEALAAQVQIQYLLLYELSGTDEFAEDDLLQFARANGALHTWPFLREALYAMTSRMGYPPFTLPVMHFHAKPPAETQPESADPNAILDPQE